MELKLAQYPGQVGDASWQVFGLSRVVQTFQDLWHGNFLPGVVNQKMCRESHFRCSLEHSTSLADGILIPYVKISGGMTLGLGSNART